MAHDCSRCTGIHDVAHCSVSTGVPTFRSVITTFPVSVPAPFMVFCLEEPLGLDRLFERKDPADRWLELPFLNEAIDLVGAVALFVGW